jgi:hypothetical protein
VGNSTLRTSMSMVVSGTETRTPIHWTEDGKLTNQTVRWANSPVTSATETARQSPIPWDNVTAPKQPLWNWNSTKSTTVRNGTHV